MSTENPTPVSVGPVSRVEEIAADLHGVHYGLNLIAEGAALIARDLARPRTTPDTRQRAIDVTQTLLATLAGGVDGNPDVLGLIAALVTHLGDPDTNPALRALPDDRAAQVTAHTSAYALRDRYSERRLLCAEAAAIADGL